MPYMCREFLILMLYLYFLYLLSTTNHRINFRSHLDHSTMFLIILTSRKRKVQIESLVGASWPLPHRWYFMVDGHIQCWYIILKAGKNPIELKSYHQSHFFFTLYKVLEKLLLRKLLLTSSKLPHYRQQHFTTDQLQWVGTIIITSLEKKEYCKGTFLEVVEALYTMWQERVWFLNCRAFFLPIFACYYRTVFLIGTSSSSMATVFQLHASRLLVFLKGASLVSYFTRSIQLTYEKYQTLFSQIFLMIQPSFLLRLFTT